MLIDLSADPAPIKFIAEPLTEKRLSDFKRAIGAGYTSIVAPSYGTTFRKGEFDLLDTLKVDLKKLLHTEQNYEYFAPFEIGDIPEVETQMVSAKERRGMVFVHLETRVSVKGELKLKSTSSFILRENNKG
jgi:hypothetical protein